MAALYLYHGGIMPIIEGTRKLKFAKGEYNFAIDGGATGQLTLRAAADANGQDDDMGNLIPVGSVVMGGYIEVDTILASGGAPTVSVDIQAVGDTLAAAAFNAAPWSTTGLKSIVELFSGATAVKTTAAQSIKITIATAALTGGKFRVVIFYK